MQIDHKVEDQSPIKIHFIYLAFVLQPLKNEFITPTIHVCLFGVNHTRTNVETIPALFMSLTVTKESVLRTDRPHLYIISSNPLPFIIWPQMINSDVPM